MSLGFERAGCAALLSVALMASGGPALAHPHVWVTARSQVQFDPSGAVTGVRHDWTFDEGFSTYAVEGLERKDGKLTPQAAEALAKLNTESLAEFDYFTFGKSSGKPLGFAPPKDYSLTEDDKLITLHFTLPLKSPAPGKTVSIEIYDPTFYVDFSLAEKNPVTLSGAPAGCQVNVKSSGAAEVAAKSQSLSESFFSNLSAGSNFGSQFANRALVVCP